MSTIELPDQLAARLAAVAAERGMTAGELALEVLANACEVRELGDPRVIGRRCADSGTSDVVNASLAVLSAATGMKILTTDPDDMKRLGADYIDL